MTWDKSKIVDQQRRQAGPLAANPAPLHDETPVDTRPEPTPAQQYLQQFMADLGQVPRTLTWSEREEYAALGLVPDEDWPAARRLMFRGIVATEDEAPGEDD